MLGINFLISSNRSHGHSCKNLKATSKVAPPQFSNEYKSLNLCDTKGEIFRISRDRTLVARRDWWASLNVVSINSNPLCWRTAFAKAAGPSFFKISLKPFGGSGPEGKKKEKMKRCHNIDRAIKMVTDTTQVAFTDYTCNSKQYKHQHLNEDMLKILVIRLLLFSPTFLVLGIRQIVEV